MRPPIITAAVAEPGMPSASIGSMAAVPAPWSAVSGAITPSGLQPSEYTEDRGGRNKREAATLDVSANPSESASAALAGSGMPNSTLEPVSGQSRSSTRTRS